MMFDEDIARIRTHRSNIHRYRRLLKTRLSDLERRFIERRLSEEQAALEALVSEAFPVAFTLPKGPQRFPAKWIPVRVKKTRQNENLEPRSDSIGTEMALGATSRAEASS